MELTPLSKRLLARVADRGALPRFGSPEWDALPDQDPRRAAAVMVAAEAWRDHCSSERVARDLLDEIHAQNHIAGRLLVEASHDVAEAADWAKVFSWPTHAELQRRRGNNKLAQQKLQDGP